MGLLQVAIFTLWLMSVRSFPNKRAEKKCGGTCKTCSGHCYSQTQAPLHRSPVPYPRGQTDGLTLIFQWRTNEVRI